MTARSPAPSSPYDVVVRAGRLVCPASGFDGAGVVAIRGDRIVASSADATATSTISAATRAELELPTHIVLPGLVDVHTHPDPYGSVYGVDPGEHLLRRGTTTALSQGDAGASNWPEFRNRVIRAAGSRIRLALNLAHDGEAKPTGSLADLRDADVDACVEAAEDGGTEIWGIAIRLAESVCGSNDPRELLGRALVAAERTNRPLLYGGWRGNDFPLADQLATLRAGDVVTYCFHGEAESIVSDGRVADCVWMARERGVLFDTVFGLSSFDFEVAETAIAQGFLPDTISTDRNNRDVGSVLPHDLPLTASKLRVAGMPEDEIWSRMTSRPAAVLGLEGEVGALVSGACADLVGLRWHDEPFAFTDQAGRERIGGYWEPDLVVRAGRVVRESGEQEHSELSSQWRGRSDRA